MAILLNDKVSPSLIRLGVFKDGETVSFSIQNNHSLPFEGYEQGCTCLGVITKLDTQLLCDLKASFAHGDLIDNGKAFEVFSDGTSYYRLMPFANVVKPFNIGTYQYEDISLDSMKQVTAAKFNKTIPIHFLDGQTNKMYDPLGKYVDNPNKHKANVTVTFYIVKD